MNNLLGTFIIWIVWVHHQKRYCISFQIYYRQFCSRATKTLNFFILKFHNTVRHSNNDGTRLDGSVDAWVNSRVSWVWVTRVGIVCRQRSRVGIVGSSTRNQELWSWFRCSKSYSEQSEGNEDDLKNMNETLVFVMDVYFSRNIYFSDVFNALRI